jgi:hypothetical protein
VSTMTPKKLLPRVASERPRTDQSLNLALHRSTHGDGNFLLLRPYHGEHGPKVPFTPEFIVLQRVLRKRECMSILTKMSIHLISND